MATVWVPSLLRGLCDGASQVDVEGATVAELLGNLEVRCPGIGLRLLVDGQLRHDLALFVDGEEAPTLAATVHPNSEVNILPAMAGGSVLGQPGVQPRQLHLALARLRPDLQ